MKTLGEVLYVDGPSYVKTKMALLEWLKVYNKRNKEGDINVVKFIEHFAEVEDVD